MVSVRKNITIGAAWRSSVMDCAARRRGSCAARGWALFCSAASLPALLGAATALTTGYFIARRTNRPLHRLNATTASISDIKDIIKDIEVGLAKTDGTYLVIPDRREAIFYAIRNAEEGDMIAIIGKGHEDYQIVGNQRLDYSDRVTVARLLGVIA